MNKTVNLLQFTYVWNALVAESMREKKAKEHFIKIVKKIFVLINP